MTDQPVATLYLRSAAECASSIAEQQQACEAHAATQGWRIGEIFVDDGVSAHDEDRPGMVALRESIEEGRTTLVLGYEPSRLFRCVDSAGTFAAFCAAHGARIAYVRPAVDLRGELHRLFEEDTADRHQRAARRTAP